MSDTPFLTVVTRCYKRPIFLQNNVQSLKAQTDPDYEQVFIIDKVGLGLAWADKALNKFKDRNHGSYVMVLDDDDRVSDINFIKTLKQIINGNTQLDVVIWQGLFGWSSLNKKGYLMPTNGTNWGKKVEQGKIGSFNYAVRNEIYQKHIHKCKEGLHGDFNYINSVLNQKGISVLWLEQIFVETQMRGKGKAVAEIEERDGKRIIKRDRGNRRKY